MKTLEQRIQERAYEIWEKRTAAGLPDANHSEQNYFLAMQEIMAEEKLVKAKTMSVSVADTAVKPVPAPAHTPKAAAPAPAPKVEEKKAAPVVVAAPAKKAAAPVKKGSKK
ncbi:MAG: DUF2934 domain-containing protein [Chitinispirillia bacterium]|nr:DUF2934 domain-containing protein [Chitinispirillia bacterium]MCL2268619.1 DUF2934 domain-containing protein [Chitinispirillia bacterium]